MDLNCSPPTARRPSPLPERPGPQPRPPIAPRACLIDPDPQPRRLAGWAGAAGAAQRPPVAGAACGLERRRWAWPRTAENIQQTAAGECTCDWNGRRTAGRQRFATHRLLLGPNASARRSSRPGCDAATATRLPAPLLCAWLVKSGSWARGGPLAGSCAMKGLDFLCEKQGDAAMAARLRRLAAC